MFDVFSTTARSSVTEAHQEARSRGNDYIGTEHLLLGVLAVEDYPVSTTLRAFNLTREAIRSRVDDSIGPEADPTPGHIPFSPRAKSALERSGTRPRCAEIASSSLRTSWQRCWHKMIRPRRKQSRA
jgi:ATP-dependent Clp protease ATP-binding subunit ClpC